jgi:anti-anti-sigma factor
LRGELDLATSGQVELVLDVAAATRARTIVLDLSELEFIDSSGLKVILAAHQRLGRRLILLRGPHRVHRLFELTGLDTRVAFAEGATRRDCLRRERATGVPVASGVGASERPRRVRPDARRRASQAVLSAAIRELRTKRGRASAA